MGGEKGNGHAKDSNDYESGDPPDGGGGHWKKVSRSLVLSKTW